MVTPTLLLRVVTGRRLIDLLGRLLLAGGLLLRGTLEVIAHRRRVEVLEPFDRLVLRWIRHASAVPSWSDFTPDRAGTSVRARKFVGVQVRAVRQWRRWRGTGLSQARRPRSLTDARTPDELMEMAHQLRA